MTIDVSPEIEARLKAMVFEEDARRIRLTEFNQAIDERLRSLSGGQSVDGEEVMARLIGEFDEHLRRPSAL